MPLVSCPVCAQCVVCPLESRGAEAAWQAVLWEWGKEDRALPHEAATWHCGCIVGSLGAPAALAGFGARSPLGAQAHPKGKNVGWR